MSKRSKYLWISIGLISVTIIGWLYFRSRPEKEPAWKTALVQRGNISVLVTATGSLTALKMVDVGTQVSGIIAKLFADYNSEVKKGQVIAVLDTSILSASYDEIRALRQKSIIQLNELKQEFARQKKLFDANAISKSEYDLALSNYQGAQASLLTSEAQLKKAKINRQYAVIHAPIDGVVISRNVDVGQTVVSSFNSPVLFTIANDLKKMQVYANVDEADIGQVKPGQEVSFTVDAYPREIFPGSVKQIRLQPVIVQNVVTYIVIIDVANPDLKLLPGLTANISFKIKEKKNVLKVQSAALQFTPPDDYVNKTVPAHVLADIKKRNSKTRSTGDTAYVWIKKVNGLQPVKVVLGLIESGYTEISGNINENDELVVRAMEDESATQSRNPFVPSFRQPRRGM